MADAKISDLTPVTTVEDTDEFVLARSGSSNKITGANLKATSQGLYDGDGVTIANGASELLTFDRVDGDALLDISDVENPTFVAAGTYAITVQATAGAPLTSGGFCGVFVSVGGHSVAVAEGAHPETVPAAAVCVTQADQGDTLNVTVFNFDGASTRTFVLGLGLIVKIA